jgi:hypothetical protein
VYSLVGGLVPGNSGSGVCLVDIVVLPMGLQTPSAPSVLSLTPPLGPHAQSNGWLRASTSAFVRLWQGLSGDSYIRFIPHTVTKPRQYCGCQEMLADRSLIELSFHSSRSYYVSRWRWTATQHPTVCDALTCLARYTDWYNGGPEGYVGNLLDLRPLTQEEIHIWHYKAGQKLMACEGTYYCSLAKWTYGLTV